MFLFRFCAFYFHLNIQKDMDANDESDNTRSQSLVCNLSLIQTVFLQLMLCYSEQILHHFLNSSDAVGCVLAKPKTKKQLSTFLFV